MVLKRLDESGVCEVVQVKLILSAQIENGRALGSFGAVEPHKQPVKTQYITVKNNPGLYFSIACIINKGVPCIIEACVRGAPLEMRNGNLCTGK